MTDLDQYRPTARSGSGYTAATARAARRTVAAAALARWPGEEWRGLAADECADLLDMLGLVPDQTLSADHDAVI